MPASFYQYLRLETYLPDFLIKTKRYDQQKGYDFIGHILFVLLVPPVTNYFPANANAASISFWKVSKG